MNVAGNRYRDRWLHHRSATLPQARAGTRRQGGAQGKGLWRLERIHLGGVRRAGAVGRAWPQVAGPRARRCVLHRLGGKQRVAVRGPRRHLRRRRQQRRLSHRLAAAGGVSRGRQRHPLLLRRGRGAARQGARSARALPDPRTHRHLRHGGAEGPGRPHVHVVRRAARSRPAIRRGQTRHLGHGDIKRRTRRPDDPHLHLRHHGPAQGRDDLGPQHGLHDGDAAALLRG